MSPSRSFNFSFLYFVYESSRYPFTSCSLSPKFPLLRLIYAISTPPLGRPSTQGEPSLILAAFEDGSNRVENFPTLEKQVDHGDNFDASPMSTCPSRDWRA